MVGSPQTAEVLVCYNYVRLRTKDYLKKIPAGAGNLTISIRLYIEGFARESHCILIA